MFHGHDDRRYPLHWHTRWNDTEHAVEMPPWANCCGKDDDDECLCITSADADAWDSTYNTVLENSAAWMEKIDFSESAGLWNSCFETVEENSANWNAAYDFVNKYSESADIWNSAANLVDDNKEFLEKYGSLESIMTDESLEGDGTEELPLALNKFLRSKIEDCYGVLFTPSKVVWDADTALPLYKYDVDKKLYNANWVSAPELSAVMLELQYVRGKLAETELAIIALKDHYDKQNEEVLRQAKAYTDSKLGK